MLYVFQVETGQMLTFDMRLALESVSNLREAIWQMCRIPTDRQVLLVSGGECLDPSSGVCFYAAGTDTNPIFLFNKSNIESPTNSGGGSSSGGGSVPIQLYTEPNTIPDIDTIKDQIEVCLKLPPTYTTVVSRAQLAQQLLELAREITKKCEQLIHDQHLQHQGWAAVVANLEDIVTSLRTRFESFEHLHSQYIETKDEAKDYLDKFNDALTALDNIRVPANVHPERPTLLEWIKATDSTNHIQTLTTTTATLLQNLTNPALLLQITKETQQTIEKSNQSSMKEIKGLEERLFGLDQLLNEAKALVQEQNELAQAFQQNQTRASDLKDNSILPDLCQSHQHQLIVMSRNHGQLEDIRRRCLKAKEELSTNLNSRLKWVVYVQKLIGEIANKIHVYSESLRRLKTHIEIIKQINGAGDLYCEAVTEVLRRRDFVRLYEQHTSRIVEEMEQIHRTEVQQRKEFAQKFDNHFLSSLFQGLDDYPPSFATQRPRSFDTRLPEIDLGELTKLKEFFPQVSVKLSILPNQYDRVAISIQTDESKTSDGQTVEELKSALDAMTKLNIDIEGNRSAQIESLNERITNLEGYLNDARNQVEAEKKERQQELAAIEQSYQEKLENLLKDKDEEIKCLRENFKSEFDGLRSRYKLMQSASIEVRSHGSCEERLDVIAGGGGVSPIMSPESADPNELVRLIDSYITKTQPSPGLLRRILQRYEPSLSRQRNTSTGSVGGLGSVEENESISRSIYNIDNAVEPSAANPYPNSPPFPEDLSYREMIDSIASNEAVQNRVAKLVEADRISIQSCKQGDNVLVYWNEKLSTYIVYLHTKNIHFLHTECLKALSELEGGQESTILEFIGSVVEKEFCVARRAQNRYRVPQGFHFYRVRVNVIEILKS